jgi:DNA-binding ferritin-like protein (Dps family)
MKHEDAILKLLLEGKSYSNIKAELGVHAPQIAAVANKYLEPTPRGEKRETKRDFNDQQKRLKKLQEDYQAQLVRTTLLEENNRMLYSERILKFEELNALKKDLGILRNGYNEVLILNQKWSSVHKDLKKRFEVSEQQHKKLQDEVKVMKHQKENALVRFNEIIKSLEEGGKKYFHCVPDWAWKKIKEMSPDNISSFANNNSNL